MARSEVTNRAAELIKQFPDAPARTLAKRLVDEFSPWLTIESARSRLRYLRGTTGKANRSRIPKEDVKEPGAAGWTPSMPPTQSEPWLPFEIQEARVGILSDIHVPYHDELAIEIAIKHLKTHAIDCLLINGDYGDWYSISAWLKDPKKRNLKKEIETQIEGLKYFRAQFPKIRIVYKCGNHEEWWTKFLWNHAPEISDLPQTRIENLLGLEDMGIEWVADERPVMVGRLPIFHGHELPRGMTNPVNMARGAFLRLSHTVLVGHGHRTSTHAESNLWHDEIVCWSTGCLCSMRPKYARVNKWNHGFAFAEQYPDKQFDVVNYRISKDGQLRSA